MCSSLGEIRIFIDTVSWKIMVWLALFVKGVRTLRIVMKSSKDNPDSLMGIHNNSNAITWSPPLHNFVKVNTDVAVVFDRRVATYGEVIRVLTMVSLWVSLPGWDYAPSSKLSSMGFIV